MQSFTGPLNLEWHKIMQSVRAPNLKPKASQMPAYPAIEIALVKATDESLEGFGKLVTRAPECTVEIIQWPAPGWRPVEPSTGIEGGTTEGEFACRWQGYELHTVNEAVGGDYIAGWSREPYAIDDRIEPPVRDRVFIWHANYHPDGGQLFFSHRCRRVCCATRIAQRRRRA